MEQVSAYSTACHDCPPEEQCANCTVINEDKVLVCETILAHTKSSSAEGTLQSLELHEGFWRSSPTSKDIRECYEEEACLGGSYHYCSAGYTGPCKYGDDPSLASYAILSCPISPAAHMIRPWSNVLRVLS